MDLCRIVQIQIVAQSIIGCTGKTPDRSPILGDASPSLGNKQEGAEQIEITMRS